MLSKFQFLTCYTTPHLTGISPGYCKERERTRRMRNETSEVMERQLVVVKGVNAKRGGRGGEEGDSEERM